MLYRKRRSFKGLILLVPWVIAFAVFYLAFFVIAPAIAQTIPAGDWHQLGVVLVYVFIAWGGGIALPLYIGIGGSLLLSRAM